MGGIFNGSNKCFLVGRVWHIYDLLHPNLNFQVRLMRDLRPTQRVVQPNQYEIGLLNEPDDKSFRLYVFVHLFKQA